MGGRMAGNSCMERYLFSDPTRIPPGLHVIGVPTPEGKVWMEITATEFNAALVSPKVAGQLVAYAREVLASRWPRPQADGEEIRRGGES